MANGELHLLGPPDAARPAGGAVLWLAVAVAAVALASGSFALLSRLAREAAPEVGSSALDPRTARPIANQDAWLRVGGSGSCIALVRRAVAACRAAGQPLAVVVHEGIGSGGGLAALADGALDVALVSRPLKQAEIKNDLLIVPYARSPVALAIQPELEVEDLSLPQVEALLAGTALQWPVGRGAGPATRDGQTAQWLLREHGDSSHEVLRARWRPFAAYEAAARQSPQAQVLFHDRTMHATLQATPGAFGWVDAAAVRAEGVPLALPKIDGVAPDSEALAQSRWPWWKDQAAVTNGRSRAKSMPLLQCLSSDVAGKAMFAAGALPIGAAIDAQPGQGPTQGHPAPLPVRAP